MSTDGLMLSTLLDVLESVPAEGGGTRKAALSTDAVDVLFDRMSGVYMGAWVRALGETPLPDAKAAWAHELGGFSGNRDKMLSIAWALKNLPDYPPSAVQFRRLCEQAPRPASVQGQDTGGRAATAEERAALKQAMRDAVASMSPKVGSVQQGGRDYREWAKRIVRAWFADKTGGFVEGQDGHHHRPSKHALACAVDALGASSPDDAAAMLRLSA